MSILSGWLFYSLRSQHVAGDGALIARMTEGGKWLVQNELLAQAVLQFVYQSLSPFSLTAIEIMNLVSCVSSALSVGIIIRFGRLYRLSPGWILLLFFSSGFFIYACGHTEYYPMLLTGMLLYGYFSIQYLRGNKSITAVAVCFLLAAGIHFAMLIALPSLFLLPFLAGRKRDEGSIGLWLLLLIPLFLIRNYPQILGHKAAGLSPAWNVLPWFPQAGMIRYYAVFQWGHVLDWLYAWTMRSWIFWPLLGWLAGVKGRDFFRDRERLFLLIYTICFTGWTWVWHPDLGVEADWDLFAIEAAPCLLLVLSSLDQATFSRFLKTILVVLCSSSMVLMYTSILSMRDAPIHGYGTVILQVHETDDKVFTLDGFHRAFYIERIKEGNYRGKMVDRTHRFASDFYVVVHEKNTTVIDPLRLTPD